MDRRGCPCQVCAPGLEGVPWKFKKDVSIGMYRARRRLMMRPHSLRVLHTSRHVGTNMVKLEVDWALDIKNPPGPEPNFATFCWHAAGDFD